MPSCVWSVMLPPMGVQGEQRQIEKNMGDGEEESNK